MYIADTLNHAIRRIDLATGIVTTVGGTGEKGFSGDGDASKATFDGTFGIALNPEHDKLYIADLNNRRVRMLDLKSGMVTTVAGNGQNGDPQDGADATKSPLIDPRAVAVDSVGNLYILERRANALRVVDRTGRIRTLIRPGTFTPDLNGPKHLCVDARDNVIIADAENHLIRRYDPRTNKLVTLMGMTQNGNTLNATDALQTKLNRPHGVAMDRMGALFISDSYNDRVLKLSSF
jgi:DNA-binding beta-propeller fold protein YncE